MAEHENPSEDIPDPSLDSTVSMAQPNASSAQDGREQLDVPMDDDQKVFAIVRAIIEWQQKLKLCLQDQSRLISDRFRIIKQLGKGGFGQVYLVTDEKKGTKTSGKELALKLVAMPNDEESQGGVSFSNTRDDWFRARRNTIENWIDEIDRHQKVGRLAQDGCVPILDASVPGSKDLDAILKHVRAEPIWLAMPAYKQTLEEYVDKHAGAHGELPVHTARKIMLSVAHAVQRMHAFKSREDRDKEIIHRDLKPANILMDDQGHALIADFGLSTGRYEQKLRGNALSGTRPFIPISRNIQRCRFLALQVQLRMPTAANQSGKVCWTLFTKSSISDLCTMIS